MKQKLERTALMLSVLVVMPLISCNQTNMHELDDEPQHQVLITENDAVTAANSYMGMICKNAQKKTRLVKSVDYVTQATTRRGADTILTVVNYHNNEGFVLMAKRGSTYELFGINDENALNLSDTVENEGLSFYISSIKASIGDARKDYDSIMVSYPIYVGPTVTKKGPYLSSNVQKWHQNYPFNAQCESPSGTNLGYEQRCVTGCAPLAVCMLMSHYQWPAVINGHTVNWQRVLGNPYADCYEIAWLLSTVGKDYLHSVYGLDATYTYNRNVPPALRNLGYVVEGNWSTSDYFVNSHINSSNVPVLVTGKAIIDDEEIWHMWIRDGELSLHYPENATDVAGPYTEYFEYYVWGYGGIGDGYYKVGTTQGWKGIPHESETTSIPYRYINLLYLPSVYPDK